MSTLSLHNWGMTNTQKITVWKVEDHEGNGECSACGRTGLRWVTFLSDGSRVGGECAKKILGWAPTKAKFSWLTGMTLIAEKSVDNGHGHAVLWQSQSGRGGALAINGYLQAAGSFESMEREFANQW